MCSLLIFYTISWGEVLWTDPLYRHFHLRVQKNGGLFFLSFSFFLTSLHVIFFMFKCDGKTAESSRNLIRTHTEDIEIYFFKSLDQYNSRHAVSFWIDAVQKTVWRRLVRTADEQWTRVRESWLVDELQMWNLLSSGGESKWQLDSMSELYMWSSSAWNKDGY